MLKPLRPLSPPIGLDVGAEALKLLQLATTPAGGLKVKAALHVPIPPDVKGKPDERVKFAGETVQKALRDGRFTGHRVVAALPKELLHYKTHRLAHMVAEDVEAAARIDARDLFRFDPDSAEFRCIDAGEVKQGLDRRREVILVAAGRRYVDDFVNALHDGGARVESLGIDPCAVWRAAARCPDPGGGDAPRVLLDVGAAQSRLVIGHGDSVRVVRTIDVGADHVRTAISRKLGFSLEEAENLRRRSDHLVGVRKVLNDATRHVTDLLAREVLSALRYHAVTFRGLGPKRVELVGGDAGDAQIRAILAATLMLPAKPVNLFGGIDVSVIPEGERTATMGEWVVALGLTLKGCEGSAAESTHSATSCAIVSETAKPQAAARVAHA